MLPPEIEEALRIMDEFENWMKFGGKRPHRPSVHSEAKLQVNIWNLAIKAAANLRIDGCKHSMADDHNPYCFANAIKNYTDGILALAVKTGKEG
jgi:hypothetical protein